MVPPPMDHPITGPMVWEGRELARSTDWVRRLSPAALDEIDAALRVTQARGLAWRDIRKKDFPLPGVSAELAQVNRDLEWGRGLVLLRGLPVERYSEDELRDVYPTDFTLLTVPDRLAQTGDLWADILAQKHDLAGLLEGVAAP